MNPHLLVQATGPLATIQDLGRHGYARWGVSPSGAADRGSAQLANRLVGNAEHAGCIEVTAGGLGLRAVGDHLIAVTGARGPVFVDGADVGFDAAVRLGSDQELQLGHPPLGLRSYVAVRGGIDVAPVLGSRATDVLGGLGPPVLRAGDRLPVGTPIDRLPPVDQAAVRMRIEGEVELHVVLGPRADRFPNSVVERFLTASWLAAADSNRIGVRLTGVPLQRVTDHELPTEGLARGAIQVPPNGPPTLFLADHPVTGGYPVIAVVLDADIDRAAQVRPGQALRFRPAPPTS